jgi:hypothetical protein
VQVGPEGAGEARVAFTVSRTPGQHVQQPSVAKYGGDEVARGGRRGGGLEGRDQPHAAGQKVDVHLQAVVILMIMIKFLIDIFKLCKIVKLEYVFVIF